MSTVRITIEIVSSPGQGPEIRVLQAEGVCMQTVQPAIPQAALPADVSLQKDGGPWELTVARYLEWGAAFGGREGGWAPRHAIVVQAHLRWWKARLFPCAALGPRATARTWRAGVPSAGATRKSSGT